MLSSRFAIIFRLTLAKPWGLLQPTIANVGLPERSLTMTTEQEILQQEEAAGRTTGECEADARSRCPATHAR